MDTVNLVINLSPIGDLVQVLTSLLKQQTTDLEKTNETINYQQQLQKALPEVKLSICNKIKDIYAHIATNIAKQIDQVYQQEIEASQAAMKQAQQLGNSREENLATTLEGVQAALSFFGDTQFCLKSFQQKLEVHNSSSFT